MLTFYNERYANECYLGTATQQGSIANLVALLGYRPAPGIAATGKLAAVRPAGQSGGALAIPAGLSLSSTASPGIPSQTFEADSGMTFTGPSNVPAVLHADTKLRHYRNGSPRSVLLAGRVTGVTVGDRLVLVKRSFAGKNDYWSLVTVAAVTPATDPATGVINTNVSFAKGGWGPTPPVPGPAGAAVRKPPPWGDATDYRLLRPTATAAIIDPAVLSGRKQPPRRENPLGLSHSKPPKVRRVHLSAAVRAISPGDLVLFDHGAGHPSALAVVTATSEALWTVPFPGTQSAGEAAESTPPDIVIAHTVLHVATADSGVLLAARSAKTLDSVAVRYGLRAVGTIIGVPPATLSSLSGKVAAAYTPPSTATTAFLQDATGTGVEVTVSDAGSGDVTIAATGTPPSAISASKPLVVPLQLLLNLVPVSRGTTVPSEVLGSGNAALTSQSFTLAKSPLTYLATASGIATTLRVTVNNAEWHEVPSFYNQAATARVFVVTRSPDQTVTTVTFGDGVSGARLPSGTGNIVASYRYGSGATSPPAGLLTTINQPQLNLASIKNPVPVSGGADPESPGDVRTAAPASVITFGRAISASDYEQIALQAPGVSRATAYSAFDAAEQRMLVTVYVDGGQAGVRAATAALAAAGDPNRPVVPLAARRIKLSLSGQLMVAAGQQPDAVAAAAKAAMSSSAGGLFSPGRMGIGQRLHSSAVGAALMVPGVTAVDELVVTGPEQVLGEVLDPGDGAYFHLPRKRISIGWVSASG